MVSYMPWPLYPQGKSPWYPLYRRLGGTQSWSEHYGKIEKHPCPCQESNTGDPAHSLLTIVNELPQLTAATIYFIKV
jgi:hypothetical protein